MTSPLFLVVEDHPIMAEMICKSLEKLEPEAHCITANDPDSAEERLELEKFTLVTVDLMYGQLGGKNSGKPGINLLKHIFQHYPRLNVLVYSTEPSLLYPIIKQAESHQGSFVVADKQLPPKDFLNKARMIIDTPGSKYIPNYITKEISSIKISDREKEVLVLACENCLPDTLISQKLNLGKKTVQNSMKSIRDKLMIYHNKRENDIRLLMCKKAREEGLI